MNANKKVSGFSKLSKRGKVRWIVENFFKDPENVYKELSGYWHASDDQQKILDGISENTLCNFPLPYGVAPNFYIDGEMYCIPMVIEESSVVAAASSAAKFWMDRGGFNTEILGMEKIGQVHFMWTGDINKFKAEFNKLKDKLRKDTTSITANMIKRGGGILDVELVDLTDQEDNYYQLKATFDTVDSMGANFINSCLEQFATSLKDFVLNNDAFGDDEKDVEVIMSILSNYTPNCLVRATVSCPIEDLGTFPGGMSPQKFAQKFNRAIRIANIDPHRATTHNKGIFNGIDAVVLATGNDFRAIEACGHTYACHTGQYKSLTDCKIEDGVFTFWIDLPLALGTVGGLTQLHPIAKKSFELLGFPNAQQLMSIVAAAGLAQNFAALRSLVTTGIQKGHMKMHLVNIMNQFKATDKEMENAMIYFEEKVVSFSEVRTFVAKQRKQ